MEEPRKVVDGRVADALQVAVVQPIELEDDDPHRERQEAPNDDVQVGARQGVDRGGDRESKHDPECVGAHEQPADDVVAAPVTAADDAALRCPDCGELRDHRISGPGCHLVLRAHRVGWGTAPSTDVGTPRSPIEDSAASISRTTLWASAGFPSGARPCFTPDTKSVSSVTIGSVVSSLGDRMSPVRY